MKKEKAAYPIILSPVKKGYSVYIPDFEKNTQGTDLPDALDMAKDAIEMMGVFWEDEGRSIPKPSDINDIETKDREIKSLVMVDFDEYRRRTEKRLVKKTLTIPMWLNLEAEKEGVNFSATLQEALKAKLGV